MLFNQLVSNKLHSLFTEYGLIMTEQINNTVRYESSIIHISLVYNIRENSNYFWLGTKSSNIFVEMNNEVMRDFFYSDLKLEHLSQEDFVNNIFLFFTNEGKRILQGDKSQLNKLIKFDQHRSERYTAKLLESQNLEAANKAWQEENYSGFVKHLDKLNVAILPASFRKKYEIAKKRLSK